MASLKEDLSGRALNLLEAGEPLVRWNLKSPVLR
jgi:hypothetical protein